MNDSTSWTFHGKVFPGPDTKMTGFIYLITNRENFRKYIGQKTFFSKITKPPLKGSTKKRRSRIESDWRNYYGSSEELKADIVKYGMDKFKREILYICESKSEMNYIETYLQFHHKVLADEFYYNGIINCRIRKNDKLREKILALKI